MKSLYYFIGIMIIIFTGCKDDEACNNNPEQEIQSYFSLLIDNLEFDTIKLNCNKMFTDLFIGTIHDDHSFIQKQGPESVRLNDSIDITILIVIFDSTKTFDVYTPEILAAYIAETPGNVSVEIELEISNQVYRNQWYSDWEIQEYLEREIIDQNASFNLEIGEVIEPDCTEGWPLLPIELSYSGVLSTFERDDSIRINNLSAQLFLAEVF